MRPQRATHKCGGTCRRPHDDSSSGPADAALQRTGSLPVVRQRVLSVLCRASLSSEEGLPTRTERHTLLRTTGLVSIATLFDLCAIYATEQADACRALAMCWWEEGELAGVLSTMLREYFGT